MAGCFKKLLKQVCRCAGITLTKNMLYDKYTLKVMKKVLTTSSNCIDIGSHDGEMLEIMLQIAPHGRHFAFEPIPDYYRLLKELYGNQATVLPYALSDREGITSFQYIRNAPAYSGFKQRKYRINPDIKQIQVDTRPLDSIIPVDIKIDFIKIDVEGAEYLVLKGGKQTIQRCRPVIVFEFGLGASDYYHTSASELYHFLVEETGLRISLLQGFLKNHDVLSAHEFQTIYQENKEYYFIAHP